jgi:hypothetical protein
VDRGIALPFRDLGGRRGGWSASRPSRFTPGEDPVPIVQEAGWAPGPVWTSAKNLAHTGIRSPDRPALSQSPYRQFIITLFNVGNVLLCVIYQLNFAVFMYVARISRYI